MTFKLFTEIGMYTSCIRILIRVPDDNTNHIFYEYDIAPFISNFFIIYHDY